VLLALSRLLFSNIYTIIVETRHTIRFSEGSKAVRGAGISDGISGLSCVEVVSLDFL